jgi:hypothetical protein
MITARKWFIFLKPNKIINVTAACSSYLSTGYSPTAYRYILLNDIT